ncbi:MAG: nucleoside triphosphate pyrophosphohydrolase family protein [Bacteroidia bacterium]|nr:nucleoside triphosphate pyrophosphohydrolase family protein [Bacteroidia bacterium]
MENAQKVLEFHQAFRIPWAEKPTAQLDADLYQLRHRLLAEENEEYLEACKIGDLLGVADALGDMLYVLLGTVVTHGMQHKLQEVFEEIHRSNLSKLDENGQPIYREDGKILKSEGYFRPDLKPILQEFL